MGFDNGTTVPSRPRCTWDMKTPPWTDGKGSADQYIKAVKLWKEFHDALPANNANKIAPTLQGIILKSQLFGRAQDIGEKVKDEDLKGDDGAIKLASAVFKIDALSQVSRMSEEFANLLSTTRSENEKLKAFESRFEAQVCRFNESSGCSILPEALLALLLLNNSNMDNNQRVSLLAAVAPKSTDALTSNELQNAIKYEQVASIIRSSDSVSSGTEKYLKASSARSVVSDRAARIAKMKENSKCAECGEVGHWYKDPECPKNKQKIQEKMEEGNDKHKKKNTITFS